MASAYPKLSALTLLKSSILFLLDNKKHLFIWTLPYIIISFFIKELAGKTIPDSDQYYLYEALLLLVPMGLASPVNIWIYQNILVADKPFQNYIDTLINIKTLKYIGIELLLIAIFSIPFMLLMPIYIFQASLQKTIFFVSFISVAILIVTWTVWVGYKTMFVFAYIAIDNKNAVRSSYLAAKNNFWRIISVFILPTLIFLSLYFLFYLLTTPSIFEFFSTIMETIMFSTYGVLTSFLLREQDPNLMHDPY
ncbi:MAG: hypothetical protein IT497_05940 [Ottowia sp.]|nr:hypothetical protein [Ottowia sp.]